MSAVKELQQIPFGYLIGAPLKAAIQSQAIAAQTTIDFIQRVAFKQQNQEIDLLDPTLISSGGASTPAATAEELRSIIFAYNKDTDEGQMRMRIQVPLLSITPIPYLRIAEMTIDFHAKLTDAVERTSTSQTQISSSLQVKGGWAPLKFDFRVSATHNRAQSNRSTSNREYNMEIHVRAVQDEMPAGLSKVLQIMEDAIRSTETAVTSGTATPTPAGG